MATHGGEVIAGELLTALMTGDDVTIPNIDITTAEYTVPGTNTTDAYDEVIKFTDSNITTGVINGTGSFDKIMAGVAAQLKGEYDNGRITGTEYTKAYIALVQSGLSSSIQYVLSKDISYWQAVQAQIAAITSKVQLATAKTQNATAQLEAMNVKANYALTKLKLSAMDIEYATGKYNLDNILPKQAALLDEQLAGAIKDTETKTYTLSYILPAQKLSLQEQAEAQRGQTMDTRSDGTTPIAGSIGKQNELYSQQVISYQKDSQLKAAKVFSDVWITCRSIDEGFPLPTQFDTAATEAAMQALIDANDLG